MLLLYVPPIYVSIFPIQLQTPPNQSAYSSALLLCKSNITVPIGSGVFDVVLSVVRSSSISVPNSEDNDICRFRIIESTASAEYILSSDESSSVTKCKKSCIVHFLVSNSSSTIIRLPSCNFDFRSKSFIRVSPMLQIYHPFYIISY